MANLAELYDVGSGAEPPDLSSLHKMFAAELELEQAVENLEEDLKAAKAALHRLRTERLPDAMTTLGIDGVDWEGYHAKKELFVDGNIPTKDPEKKKLAIDWLEKEGADGLIKTQVQLSFGRGDRKEALKVMKRLEKSGFDPQLVDSVHVQTLWSFARERIAEGKPLNADVLGLRIGQVVKLRPIKATATTLRRAKK